jgi:hypothetical protein
MRTEVSRGKHIHGSGGIFSLSEVAGGWSATLGMALLFGGTLLLGDLEAGRTHRMIQTHCSRRSITWGSLLLGKRVNSCPI